MSARRSSTAALTVGDVRRPIIGRTVIATLAFGAVFTCATLAAKEIRSLSVHAPWQDDPYDAVVSFAIFFMPVIAGFQLVRLPLCRRDQPLPVERTVGLLRGSRLLLATAMVTLVAQWVSVGVGAHGAAWSPATALLVAVLSGLTLLAVGLLLGLHRATASITGEARADRSASDWLADAAALAELASARLGPMQRPVTRLIHALETTLMDAIRRHPLLAAATVSLAFGTFVATSQGLEEADVGAVSVLFLGVAACGMFAFLAAAGSYLHVVQASRPTRTVQRRRAHAIVLAAASVPVTLAFRSSLWWIIGAAESTAGPGQLAALLLLVAALTLLVVLAAESLAGTGRQ